MRKIYLDHTATTPLDPRVLDAMVPYFGEVFGNASSIHAFGREAKQALEHARGVIGGLIGAEPGEIFFTSGGTEADNFAIMGLAAASHGERRGIVSSRAEHHAVLDTCEHAALQGIPVALLPVNASGAVETEALRGALGGGVQLVSLMHANNEVGTISPIASYADLTHAAGAIFHTDAVQSAGKIPLNVRDLGVDLMTLSAHKMYGPKGIGALYIRRGTAIEPLLHGGGQERGRRPGTENVAQAIGFAEAFRIASGEMERESKRLEGLRDALEARLRAEFSALIVNGDLHARLPHILNISFDAARLPMEGEMLIVNMDLQGIAVTSGSACTSGSIQPSHVLLAMGRDPSTAKATIRFSLGRSNSAEDIGQVADALKEIVGRSTIR
jgi:cysteine desulfurase